MVLESKNFEIDKSAIFKNFCEDQNHNLWFGSAGYGIVKFSSRNDQFINEYLISDDLLGACISKKEGGNELHDVINQSDKQLLAQKIKRDGYLINSYCFAEDPITSKLWILGFSPEKNQSILVQFNPVDKTHTILPIEICQIQANESFNLLKFDSLGHLWASIECSDNVVRLYTIPFPDSDLIEYTFPIKHIQSEHSFVSDWLIDQKGAFWLGTKQGLFHFQPKSGEWKQWHPDPTSSHALSHDHILSLCPDPVYPDRFLWIGTDGGGLNKMDIQQETFRTFSTQNGLTNNVVYGVLADQHDNLWISSNRGLNLIHPDTGIIQSFSQQDGLPSDEFNRFEFGKTSDQKLYFGSIGGAVVFDPEVFYISSVASPLVINRLWLSGKEVHFRNLNPDLDTHFILPAPLENCTKIILPYSERMLTLGFSLLDFTNPNGIKYRYKLEGFNQDWVESNIDNVAGFTNLSPGRYTFLVSGLNSYNIWSDPTSLEILIQPPWWGTWWFRSIIVLCIISLVYLFYRYRLQQAMRLQHLRNRIAADLHDEIGSTLSSIALAGTVIQHKLKTTDHEVNGLLNKINHHTQSMMEAMSDIVWAVNTKNDRFDQVLHRMRAFSVEILEPKEVTIHFTVAPGVTPLLLDMQQRKNLYLIFKESIHNIAKYAHCEWVQVVITYMHGDLRMEVKDNGVGFASDQTIGTNNSHQGKNLGGNGIQNMYQRAKELKGKLEVESSLGAGTKIVLIFPV